MELPEDEEDGDYSPSESDSDDSLEWASETERTILPVSSVQRAARAARRAGMKGSEGSLRSSLSAVVDVTNSILSYMGYELVSTLEDSSKPHLEPGTMPYTPEQEFGEMTLSD